MTSETQLPPIQHEFLALDEGLEQLLHVDERDPSRDWAVPLCQPQVRDMQLVGGGRLMVSHHHGYAEFDIATGDKVKDFAELNGVTSARRQADGSTILAGVNLAGLEGVVILELDAGDGIRNKTLFEGDYVRLIRQTGNGTFLMSCNTMIREGSRDGHYLGSFPGKDFYHAWKSVRLPNGNLLVSAGYGAFMVELAPDGRTVRKFGGKEEMPAKVNPFFYGMFHLLPNGHVVVANWQGHGRDHGASGIQLLEFDRGGQWVWSWSDAGRISSLQGVLVLDGLDVSRLHDERCGLMTPMEIPSTAAVQA